MQRNFTLVCMLILLTGCTSGRPSNSPSVTATVQVNAKPAEEKDIWAVYDPGPDHPWNRVFRQLYRRTTVDGKEYGSDELDPLLWFDTTYLLSGVSYRETIQVLDEFLTTHAENLIQDPLKHAMFQHDLWAVFDWLASQPEPYPDQRRELETRLARIIRRVALTRDEIASLPDNYTQAVQSGVFPTQVPVDHPETAFLPADLFQADSAWVPMGREGGPVAMTHVSTAPFFGRSVFLVFVRSPQGRARTLNFIESLNMEPDPATAPGSEVALVRRMLLIDDQGELTLSPLIETVQIRHFATPQIFHEFELDRRRLFAGLAGGMEPKTDLFMLFMSHGDVFEKPDIPELQVTIPGICTTCHFHNLAISKPNNTRSIISYSRQPFSLPDNSQPVLRATTWENEAQTVIEWKHGHTTWQTLEVSWKQASP
ncbi:MAG TPA: hypothetical protein VLE49_07455 [Anaerolineales bacterium]|nr:hypothetical protein [Anaerolineales bacterium]